MGFDGTFMGFDGILFRILFISIVNGDLWDLMAFWLDYIGLISIVNGDLWDLMELLWDLMAFWLDLYL